MNQSSLTVLFSILLLHSTNVFAQNLTCADLTKEVFNDSVIIKPNNTNNPPVKYAKPNTQILDVKYITDSLGEGGTQHPCSTSTNCTDGSSSLVYEVYYPNIQYSDTRRLSALIFFHGGGFSDCVNFHSTQTMTYCTEFTKRGFVVFNVEYRRGTSDDNNSKYTSASRRLAIYRAVQDARGAIRTIVSRELNKVTPYRINERRIFLAGPSAGSAIAIVAGYYNSTMINQIFAGVSSHLGVVDADNYLGNAARGSYTIKGVLDLWGQAYVPLKFANNPANFFSQNSQRPALIAFHGGSDPVAKIDSSDVFFSPSTSSYGSESLCVNGTYTLPDNGANGVDLKLHGSASLYNIFKTSLNIPCELYIDCDMQHNLNESTSDFGLANGNASAVTNKQVQIYIVQRAATFFQYVINPNFPYTLTHTKFVNCLNTRSGCNPDSGTTCSNTATCSNGALQNSSTIVQQNLTAKKETNSLFIAVNINKAIYIKFFKAANSKIVLLNLNGIPVKTMEANSTEVVLNGTDLSAGIYLLRVTQGKQMQTAKIVLQ
jgi:acetyl esterase/lipase